MSSSTLQKPLRVLVSGAGISGPVLAYWLGKAGASVTVLERSPKLRKEGQTIDIEDHAVNIVKWMGVEQEIKRRTTKEAGIRLVDTNGRVKASFPLTSDGTSFTSQMEIVRGELASILYHASKDKAEYIFGDTVSSIDQTADCARVTLRSEQEKNEGEGRKSKAREYDIVIISEGLTSRTRALAFKQDVRAPIKPLHRYIALFSYAQNEEDDQWAKWYNAPGRRVLFVRPDGFGRVRANVLIESYDETLKEMASSQDRVKQKKVFTELFRDAGWQSERILNALDQAQDLYVQEIAQAKCQSWSTGRVVIVGDSAYCPSPLSGTGSTAAIIGAYVLAAEIIKHGDDYNGAFVAYEATLRKWIEGVQDIPSIFLSTTPDTPFGIRVLHTCGYAISLLYKIGFVSLLARLPDFGLFGNKLTIPDSSVFD